MITATVSSSITIDSSTTSTIVPGQHVNSWEIISIDPSGRRACCRCKCGEVRLIALGALASGEASPSCGCTALPRERVEIMREERKRQRQHRDLKDWRPGGRS